MPAVDRPSVATSTVASDPAVIDCTSKEEV